MKQIKKTEKNGGRPKKAKENEDNLKEPNGFFENQSKTKKADSDNDNEHDSEYDNDSENDIKKENKEKVDAFRKGFGTYES